jgi:protein-disulfide isomerase
MENMPSEENRASASAAAAAARNINPYILPGSIVLAALIIGGALIYLVQSGGTGGGQPRPVILENPVVAAAAQTSERDPVRGSADAPVLVVEYGDYQCPFCARYFSQVEPAILEQYVNTGKARFVFRHLAFLGPESVAAAEATECAKDQGKFWEYHAALYGAEIEDEQANPTDFENNGNLNRALFLKLANQIGLNAAIFAQCIDSRKYASAIQEDNAAASAIGVYSTPTTFVNGRKVVALDANGNPIPGGDGNPQSVGADTQSVLRAIEAAVQAN